eukprot:CAMPEP_0194035418 /NCGR_PEP_ID=MMETSP0009_2-20130614/7843_1 /TAXON_ID=210454 /ORGANISM="Grammatophora oceanica, Strain CCMP 410" /LENGTH=72 /DNA_ID=CAMNT_0038676757 /DNA_START=45 /DNA_END=259 /DNA_ORIENTATION=-
MILFSLLAFGLLTSAAYANTSHVLPLVKAEAKDGTSISGQAWSVLSDYDQSGGDDTWDNYIEVTDAAPSGFV